MPHLLIALAQKLYLVRFLGEMSTIGVEKLEKSWEKKNFALLRQLVDRFLRGLCCPFPSYQNEAGMQAISVPEPGDLLWLLVGRERLEGVAVSHQVLSGFLVFPMHFALSLSQPDGLPSPGQHTCLGVGAVV